MSVETTSIREIVLAASAQDPSIEPAAAEPIVRTCLEMLHEEPGVDVAELARRCVVRHAAADASWVTHIARAAVALTS